MDFEQLKRRKLVQWALAYVAGAWALLQGLSLLSGVYAWPPGAMRIVTGCVFVGFPIALVLAWFHGEQGRQKATGGELAILALLLVLGGGALWQIEKRMSATSARPAATPATPNAGNVSAKSIAVLPFTNMSADKENEFFSDGIAEEILNALAQVKDLKVAGRTSSFHFKGKNELLTEIGATLGVANVLEGSVRKQGDKVRITAQLIQVKDGFHLWSETYDGDLADVFQLQERIARSIAEQLQLVLSGAQETRLVNAGTANARAYTLYLDATSILNRRDGPRMSEAIAKLEQAVALDPKWARGYARLAMTAAIASQYRSAELVSLTEHAMRHADTALALDPELGEPRLARAFVLFQKREFVASRDELERVLARDPDDLLANFYAGTEWVLTGYGQKGAAPLDRTLAADPLFPNALLWRGSVAFVAGDLQSAEQFYRRAETAGLAWAGFGLSEISDAQGRREDAIEELTRALKAAIVDLPPGAPETFAAGTYGDAAAREAALAWIDRYLATRPAVVSANVPGTLLRLGRPEQSLELALARPGGDTFFFRALFMPFGASARRLPQFPEFARDIGLAALWEKYGAPQGCRRERELTFVCQ